MWRCIVLLCLLRAAHGRSARPPYWGGPGAPHGTQIPALASIASQLPKYNIMSFDVNLGPYKASMSLGSDLPVHMKPGLLTAQNLEQLRGQLHVDDETKYQLQMFTRTLLETFGLYEPFRKKTKSLVLNNPVYYGEKSGMVNYSKSVRKEPHDVTELKSGVPKWEGLNGQAAGSVDGRHDLTRTVTEQEKA